MTTGDTITPLPPAGGAGGGRGAFKPRDTTCARDLRNTASPAERRLWSILARRALAGYKFSRQMPVGPYFADFLCREAKLVVEVDGYSHDLRLEQDARRDAFMASEGYAILRFINDEVMNSLDGVAHAIAQSLAVRCPPPTPPASGRGD
jgi:very-short-patch-repair endonuclease